MYAPGRIRCRKGSRAKKQKLTQTAGTKKPARGGLLVAVWRALIDPNQNARLKFAAIAGGPFGTTPKGCGAELIGAVVMLPYIPVSGIRLTFEPFAFAEFSQLDLSHDFTSAKTASGAQVARLKSTPIAPCNVSSKLPNSSANWRKAG